MVSPQRWPERPTLARQPARAELPAFGQSLHHSVIESKQTLEGDGGRGRLSLCQSLDPPTGPETVSLDYFGVLSNSL